MRFFVFLGFFFLSSHCFAVTDSIGGNPASSNFYTGTGALGRSLGFNKNSGVRIGGQWIGDVNWLMTRGLSRRKWTVDSLIQLSLNLDTEKLGGWKGGIFGVEYLQFNGGPTNSDAGVAQGYNGLIASTPLNRYELYQYWFRQEFLSGKFVLRIGKSVPLFDFNNVIRPIPLENETLSIPSVTSLIYTPIFVNSTMLGVLPGYYDSAFGITATYLPSKHFYASYGIFDGNLARGKRTGLRGPQFNGYYFQILESGASWFLGENKKPGTFGIGAWNQSGKLSIPHKVWQKGARGAYLFGSQRLWWQHPNKDNSGLNGFFQFGINNSKVLPFSKYVGLGFTAIGLIPNRINDSMGVGMALAWLNRHLFPRRTELMFQAYYQTKLLGSVYLEPVISYIPTPGLSKNSKNIWASTVRVIALF